MMILMMMVMMMVVEGVGVGDDDDDVDGDDDGGVDDAAGSYGPPLPHCRGSSRYVYNTVYR